MTTKYLLIIILLISNWTYVLANSTVGGVVTSTDGNPIEFVIVFVDKLQRSTMTNEKGEYSLSLPSGEHSLQFSCFNYTKTERAVSLSDGKEEKLNVVLLEVENTLSEVVVVGRTERQEIETKGFAVNVIETQQLALQSVQTVELLDRTAGVSVRQNGGLGSTTNYNLNGMSGNSVSIFIDGIPISTYGSSFSLIVFPHH